VTQPAGSVTFLRCSWLLSSHYRSSLILLNENCIRENSVSALFLIRSFSSHSLYLGRVLPLLKRLEFSMSLNLTPIRGTLSQNTLTELEFLISTKGLKIYVYNKEDYLVNKKCRTYKTITSVNFFPVARIQIRR
jgi:hypothetical protein